MSEGMPREVALEGGGCRLDGLSMRPGEAFTRLLPEIRAGRLPLFHAHSQADAATARLMAELAGALAEGHARPAAAARPAGDAAGRLLIVTGGLEALRPSGDAAVARFAAMAQAQGLDAIVWRLGDGAPPDADAAFVRTYTEVGGEAHEFVRAWGSKGRPVLDTNEAIIRGGNKIFQALTFHRAGVPVLPTRVVFHASELLPAAAALPAGPLVLKSPGEAFCQGVHLVRTRTELLRLGEQVIEAHGGAVLQAFRPTAFDWRIGVLDGKPLFAARYGMAAGSWRLCEYEEGEERWGEAEPAALSEAPSAVIEAAVRAAKVMGPSLWGIDVKELDAGPAVVEVNDNPDMDEAETAVLEDAAWRRLADWFVAAVAARPLETAQSA